MNGEIKVGGMHWVKDRRDRWIGDEDDVVLATMLRRGWLRASASATEAALLDEIKRLRTEVAGLEADCNAWDVLHKRRMEHIERLRAAGDALADNLRQMEDCYHSQTCKGLRDESTDNCTSLVALAAWNEARRER